VSLKRIFGQCRKRPAACGGAAPISLEEPSIIVTNKRTCRRTTEKPLQLLGFGESITARDREFVISEISVLPASSPAPLGLTGPGSLRHGQQYVAVPAAGQQAIFQYAGISQSMNEEQTPDEQQQYDHDTNKVSGLTFGGLAVQFVI
jgi:hypothetical protein